MMEERQRHACEFQLLRYVPDAVRNEYVHIGVILREQGGPPPRTGGRDRRDGPPRDRGPRR